MNSHSPDNFPVNSLPLLIKNAVLEVQNNTHFPLPLIVSSALGAISLACQNSIDVSTPVGSVSPCSLFMLLVADSGEGKTPTDNFFIKPIRDFEENEAKKLEDALPQQKAQWKTWELKRKAIETAISKNHTESLFYNLEQANLLELEQKLKDLNQKLEDHLSIEPKQRKYKLISSDTTPMQIALDLKNKWPSMGLISGEAGSIFKGRAMKDLAMLNTLWDGDQLIIDRTNSTSVKDLSFTVKDARLTISLMAQGEILNNYLKGRGDEARGIGFIARCLVAFPFTTKGSRMLDNQPQDWTHLTIFQQRITEILTQDKLDVDQGRQTRPILEFSQEAKDNWLHYRNETELALKEGGYLSDVNDSASKISTNEARMAALFHFFEGQPGDISDKTEWEAGTICVWYIHEFKRLFAKNLAVPIEVSDAHELEQCLIRWCQNHPDYCTIQKSNIAQYGPNQLRNNKSRREDALNKLALQNKIRIKLDEKPQLIILNPNFFPTPWDHEKLFSATNLRQGYRGGLRRSNLKHARILP